MQVTQKSGHNSDAKKKLEKLQEELLRTKKNVFTDERKIE
jgi:hypothetical protein